MILDARDFEETPDFPDVPVVIIGAGTVGLFLAVNLARAGIPTIVLEAGGQVADTRRSAQTAISVGVPHAGITSGRVFGLGGTSTLWAGQLAEFDEIDLRSPGKEWPLKYSELQRWYQAVYTFLEVKPIQPPSIAAASEDGPEDGIERFVTSWLPRPNFASRFRTDITSNPLLTVVLNATVSEITLDGSVATAVYARMPEGTKIRISGRRFVFACGTLETSRFFLSTQRLFDVPWKYNKNIGAYFQDHLVGKVATAEILNEGKFRDFFEHGFRSGIKFQPKLRNAPGFKRPAFSGVVGSFEFPSRFQERFDELKSLIRTVASGLSSSTLRTIALDLCSLSYALFPVAIRFARHRRIMVFLDQGTEFLVQAEQIPTAASAIRLMDEPCQRDGLFRAAVHWRLDGGEVDNICDFVCRSNGYLQHKQIAKLQIDPSLLSRDRSILARLVDFYHQAGGMCASSSASSGVVDSECRVWGTANVFVAGASVFPTSSHANVTLTALALTARLGDTLMKLEKGG
jgi:choline dehydrogenase-like flavoprotein